MGSRVCIECSHEFDIPRQRGRPATRCPSCRDNKVTEVKVQPQYDSKTRVDNLEMLLKSRGTHISQNGDQW
jgi:DNA-directed RNA polymerase subunit RPC12/RpoP